MASSRDSIASNEKTQNLDDPRETLWMNGVILTFTKEFLRVRLLGCAYVFSFVLRKQKLQLFFQCKLCGKLLTVYKGNNIIITVLLDFDICVRLHSNSILSPID